MVQAKSRHVRLPARAFAALSGLARGLAHRCRATLSLRPFGNARRSAARETSGGTERHGNVTREDVIGAYRYLLGREPENEQVIAEYQQESSFASLREAFLRSEEFQARLAHAAAATIVVSRHQLSGPMHVELENSREQLAAMLDHVARSWRTLGETEPHWSVLAFERFRGMKHSAEDFYVTGQQDLRLISAFFERAGFKLAQVRSCLEFGCGVGRVTWALAAAIPAVYGVDASSAHLELARERLRAHGVTNIEFLLLKSLDDIDRLPSTDFLFSSIVLQHDPPPLIDYILDRLLAQVSPGGFALFQLPTYRPGYRFVWSEYCQAEKPLMEMHVLPQARVFARLEKHGFDILEVQEDAKVRDPVFISQTFFAKKRKGHIPVTE
jgi:SAM-dependent methyltransferase